MKKINKVEYIFRSWGLTLMTHTKGEYIVFIPKGEGKEYLTTFTLEKLKEMAPKTLNNIGKFIHGKCYEL